MVYLPILRTLRLPFLLLTPACLSVGFALSIYKESSFELLLGLLVLLGGLSAHGAVNAFNEYVDFKNGLDLKTTRTPFSGGSGALPTHPHLARATLILGLVLFATTCVIGLCFLYMRGWPLLLSTLPGLFALLAYAPFLVHHAIPCLIAPGLGFGISMVLGTEYVLSGSYSAQGVILALPLFCLVNNLLLLNQFSDIEADKTVGRRNIPLLWGTKKSAILMGIFFVLAYGIIAAGIFTNTLPQNTAIAFLGLPLAGLTTYGAYKYGEDINKLKPFMGMNVALTLVTPLLLTAGLML